MGNKYLLLNYVFLSCLLILVLNDHYFKFHYTSWFTGKLSDIVGIILLPMLLTFLLPKLGRFSVIAAGLFFIFWKSSLSENFIQFYNIISPIGIERVVDYSDLLVLLLLPVPYYLMKEISILERFSFKKVNTLVVLLPTVFILMSTSPPRKAYYYSKETGVMTFPNLGFDIKKTEPALLSELKNQNIAFSKDTAVILEKSKYRIGNIIELNQKAIAGDGTISRINNDSLKALLIKEIDRRPDYIIPELQIGDRTVKNIRFSTSFADRAINPKKFTYIRVHSVEIDKNLDQDKIDDRLREIYQNIVMSKFKNF